MSGGGVREEGDGKFDVGGSDEDWGVFGGDFPTLV